MTGGLVLDTHIWIWLVEDHPRLPSKVSEAIEMTAREAPVHVPAICLWEVAMLVSLGRLALGPSTEEWLAAALGRRGFRLAPIDAAIAADSCGLPEGFRSDPADNMIVATARALDAPLVTHDKKIRAWASRGHVRLLSV